MNDLTNLENSYVLSMGAGSMSDDMSVDCFDGPRLWQSESIECERFWQVIAPGSNPVLVNRTVELLVRRAGLAKL